MFQASYAARQQYLAAQEEARVAQLRAEAAKAEYLAQEALLQEEAALKARLYEIEQRKRYASTNPYALTGNQFAQPYAASYPSFSPPGLPLPTRQALPSTNFLELEYNRQLEIQTRERLRKEAEQERLRKEYEAKLVLRAELERKKQIEAIKAAEAFAQPHYHTHAPSVFPIAHREGTKVFFSTPTLKAAPAPAPKAVSQPSALPRQIYPFADLDGKLMLASLLGIPTTSVAQPQAAAKAPSQPKTNPAPPAQKAHPSPESLVDQLKARSKSDSNEVHQPFLAVLNALPSRPSSAKQVPRDTSKKPSVKTSLVEQLQARSKSDHDQELRDTIQATLSSLLPESKRSPSLTPSTSHSRSSSQDKVEPETPVTPTVESRFEEIHRIEEEFRKFESEFNFPSQLDFVSSPNAATTALAHLAYTSRNHPVRFYEQALGSLLTELDSIESQGDAALRSKRKETVNLVERALETLEEQIMGRWNASKAKEEAPVEAPVSSSVPISDAFAPEEEKVKVDSAEPAPALVSEDAPVESSGTAQAPVLEESQQANTAISSPDSQPTVEASDESASQPQPQPESDSLPEITLEELEQLEESEDASPFESQLSIKPHDTSSEDNSTVSPVELTNFEENDSNDGFLVTHPENKDGRLKRKSIGSSVEDISSDWSDLEA